jgi:hypothetical protein
MTWDKAALVCFDAGARSASVANVADGGHGQIREV